MFKSALALMLLAGSVATPKSCNISFGSGSDNASAPSSADLSVPFFSQNSDLYCAPAAIQMWAAYDGVPASQQDIANYIGCTPQGGTDPGPAVRGVQHFTTSGRDAALLYNGGAGDPTTLSEEFYSAEITSISALVPLIPLINGGLHAVVLVGGQWHIDTDHNLYVWDSVIYHDPEGGPSRLLDVGPWTGLDGTQHIISTSASAGAVANFNKYGAQVAIRGSGLGGHPLPY
jgi:hypothetical protein